MGRARDKIFWGWGRHLDITQNNNKRMKHIQILIENPLYHIFGSLDLKLYKKVGYALHNIILLIYHQIKQSYEKSLSELFFNHSLLSKYKH